MELRETEGTSLWAPGDPLTRLPGVGDRTAEKLAAQGLRTVRDLLHFFPRRYRELHVIDRPDAALQGMLVRLCGTVRVVRSAWLPGRRSVVTVEFAADEGTPFAVRFFNQPWLKKNWSAGERRAVEGRLERERSGKWVVQTARVLPPDATVGGEVQLRYAELEGVTAARLTQWIAAALERVDWAALALPPLPPKLRHRDADVRALFFAMHRPADVAAHERAREHFAVREAVALFAMVERARAARASRAAVAYPIDAEVRARIAARLPFVLTPDQQGAVDELHRRLAQPQPMGVLLQGDVGTGKTAVAVAAALAVLARGSQVAFLLPTELLAEQMFATVAAWLAGSGVVVELVTASRGPAERATAAARLCGDGPVLAFGTHALLSEHAAFRDLGMVVIDEQHRFGVEQRMALVHKGKDPHVLVMTATPIPRTLALTLFGDLDVLTLRQRPAGRPAPRALHVPADRHVRVVRSIRRALRRGGKVFVVCPAVGEDGEKGGAIRVHEALGALFRCRLVHGRMPVAERQGAVAAFARGDCQVLVGTTVLEVGVDVPAATLMVILGADRFGLATLHQLRGRVGRGRRRGLCIVYGPKTPRVEALCRTTDGFELAEADLRLRGSGELLGTAQSGFADLRALDPLEDLPLLLEVRDAVRS